MTYGTASAPFLAVRALFYIADNCPNKNIQDIIKEDFYMDDLLSGADTIHECETIQQEVSSQLSTYGFNLRKWLSNEKQIIRNVETAAENAVIQFEDGESVKTLGLQWDPVMDHFDFKINFSTKELTKRHALSEVARIFDPLGWLSPVTIVAKLFIQKLWLSQLNWDDILSEDHIREWHEFVKYLPELQQIKVPRWIQTTRNSQLELHGFSDASEKAYAAVIYAKIDSSIILLTAKTKVNPIKNRKTLPKLELCAAHLLAKLINKVAVIIKHKQSVYAWSDSTITLGWINNKNNKDKFVRNKVSEITNLIPNAKWNHVGSKDNPADVASRGICARKLKDHYLWWNGPEWLKKPAQCWPTKEEYSFAVHKVTTLTSCTKEHFLDEMIQKYSNFIKLQRVVAYVLRFINTTRYKLSIKPYLTVSELEAAEKNSLAPFLFIVE